VEVQCVLYVRLDVHIVGVLSQLNAFHVHLDILFKERNAYNAQQIAFIAPIVLIVIDAMGIYSWILIIVADLLAQEVMQLLSKILVGLVWIHVLLDNICSGILHVEIPVISLWNQDQHKIKEISVTFLALILKNFSIGIAHVLITAVSLTNNVLTNISNLYLKQNFAIFLVNLQNSSMKMGYAIHYVLIR